MLNERNNRSFFTFKNPSKPLCIAFLLSIVLFLAILARPSSAFFMDWYSSDGESKYRLSGAVTSYIERFYVDQDNVRPKHMLLEALSWTERLLPSVLVTTSEASDTIEISSGGARKELSTENIETLDDMLLALRESLVFIQANRPEPNDPKPEDLEYTAINGILTDLDPHSLLLPPKEYKEFRIGTSGRFGGLGMVVGIRDMYLTVISTIEGTPAHKAGLKRGDKIMQIDNESTVNMSLFEAVGKLRGEPGTNVTLYIHRDKTSKPETIPIKRAVIALPSIEAQPLGEGLGYIRIRSFQEDTAEDLDIHLDELKSEYGEIRGLIIDMRNNSGGLLDQAIKVSDRFLEDGVIVVTTGPGKRRREVQVAEPSEDDVLTCPIVVLMDSSSASGAEIVAAALKENGRAVIVGDRSFGKGTVQQLIDMADGSALKLTIAKYLTPLYRDIQTIGVTPDISLVPVAVGKDEIFLVKGNSDTIRESDMEGHLRGTPSIQEEPLATLRYLKTPQDAPEDEKLEGEDPYKPTDLANDRQVQLSKELLKSTNFARSEEMLEDMRATLEDLQKSEEEHIVAALEKAGIDWSEGKSTETPRPTVSLETDPFDKRIMAGEKASITISVTNERDGALYRMFAVSESKNPLLDKLEFPLGKIDAGETRSYTNEIEMPKGALDRSDEFIIKFNELNGYIPKDLHGDLTTVAQKRPRFAYSYQVIESGSNGHGPNDDGLIQKGEHIDLLVTVKNVGEGNSSKNMVTLRELSHKEVFVEEGSKELGELAPGENKTVSLRFHVRENIEANEFTVDLVITDLTYGVYLTDKLTFPILEPKAVPLLAEESRDLIVVQDEASVYGGRSIDAPIMSEMNKGFVLKSDGSVPGWYRVKLSNGGWGWVVARDVAETSAQVPVEDRVKIYVQHAPPVIGIERPPTPTQTPRIVISGEVFDEDGVKHVYVLVNNDKVYLNTPENATETKLLEFKAEVSLEEGPNNITVVARDTSGLLSTKSFVTSAKTALVKGIGETGESELQ
ncbi:MAG: S41 family peptidase [Candidatus Brocadiales bacterium]|nr:S41 family peptidase [Candidatus Bathyanammoxibius amoris]